MHLHQVGLHEKARLAAAGTADDKDIFIPGVLRLLWAAVHGQPLRLRQNDVVLKYRVDVGLDVLRRCPMKRFVKCFFELLTQIIVKVRKCKVQRVCVLHFQLAGSGGCFFLMKLYH